MYDESLVSSEVCVQCGACCSVYVRKGTTELVSIDELEASDDVELIACPHLQVNQGRYICGNYENRPQVCRDYSCLRRANENNLPMSEDKALARRVRQTVRQVHKREIELVLL